jgi:glycylpeptide N-tetradecanoyltransferase
MTLERVTKKSKNTTYEPTSHPFWSDQPVPQSVEETNIGRDEGRPIDKEKDPITDIQQTPLNLPSGYEWVDLDVDNPDELEGIYCLLRDHYVEDDDNMFRFNYSKEFLCWALKPPGYKKEWHLGVRVIGNKRLVGFITAIPIHVHIYNKEILMVEINFLCVYNKLRANRLAPVLIKEITRRANVNGIFQAVYTAGITLPTPISSCRYYHRSLNPKKLIEVNFSQLKPRMTMTRTIRLYQLPEQPQTPGLRPIEEKDIPSACALLSNYLAKFDLFMEFNVEEFKHWFTPRDDVIYCYVAEDPDTHKVTDMISFYSLPSTIIGNQKYPTLRAAYSFYNVATKQDLTELMKDSLILAKKHEFDVFNCLEIHDNKQFLQELKFGVGDGFLQYYLYNWLARTMEPDQVGLVLL